MTDDALDWNRLLAGDARAVDPAHQDAFDTLAALRADGRHALDVLRELVACKDMKDRAQAMNYKARGAPGKVRRDLLLEYERRKPLAWERARALLAAQEPRPEPDDPLDWPLPCDVKIGHGTHKKGTTLRSLQIRANAIYEMARDYSARQQSELQKRRAPSPAQEPRPEPGCGCET